MISSAQSSFQKLVARGSDGREYPFVAKGSEDLRQDDRIERLFRAMDALLLAHPGSRHRGLTVRTFHVAPLSARCGLLEFVGGTTPMLEAVRGSTKDGNNCVKEHQFWIRAQASAKDKDTGQGQGQGRGGGGQNAQNAGGVIDPKTGMYRRRTGLVGARYGSQPANGNADFLVAMARCPRDDAAFILSHLGRITADAGAAAYGRGGRRVHLGRWRFEFRPPSRRFGYPSGARGASGARGGGGFPRRLSRDAAAVRGDPRGVQRVRLGRRGWG